MKRFKTLLSMTVLMLLIVCMSAGVTVFAVSPKADDFNMPIKVDAVYPMGKTADQMKAAMNDKIKSINAQIAELNLAGMPLEEAYNNGELVIYSRNNNGIITNDNIRDGGFKVWDGRPVSDLSNMNAGFDGWGEASIAWICYNAISNQGVIVAGKFAEMFEKFGKIGVPLADKFRVAGEGTNFTEYQNFTNGYMISVNGGECTYVLKKNMELTGVEKDEPSDANGAGYIGAINKEFTLPAGMSGAQFSDKFITTYNDLKAKGIDAGYPFSMVGTSNNYPFVAQEFLYGSSVAQPWDLERANWSYLAWDGVSQKAYLIKDEFMYVYENGSSTIKSALKELGNPTGNDFAVEDNRYQNFTNGYIKVIGATPLNTTVSERVSVIKDKNMGGDGVEISIDANEWVGMLDASIEELDGITKEQLTALFKAEFAAKLTSYTDLKPTGLVIKDSGVIIQTYTTSSKVVAIAYNSETKKVYFMSVASYMTYSANKTLGYPTTDIFQVATGDANASPAIPAISAQGFKEGYIKIQITTQLDENLEEYFVEKGQATLGSKYNAEFGYFENINYLDQVGALSTAESGSSSKPSNANPHFNVPEGETLTKLFKDGYQRALEMGFNAGKPDSEGVVWWVTGQTGVVKASLTGGNGDGKLFGGNNTMLMYDADNKIVRVVTSGIGTAYCTLGASGNGYPISDMMISKTTGTIIQNFKSWDESVQDRYVYFITPNGDTSQTKKMENTFTFTDDYVPYLSQFKSSSLKIGNFTPEAKYDINKEIAIDIKALVANPAGYSLKFSSNIGSISADGIWKITPTEKGALKLEVMVYAAFEKVDFTAELSVGEEQKDPDSTDKPTKKGCGFITFGLGGGGFTGLMGLIAVGAILILKRNKSQKIA